jgi:hypothetical protein
MVFVLFQQVHDVDERIRLHGFRDRGEEGRVKSAQGSVVLERNFIGVTRRIWLCASGGRRTKEGRKFLGRVRRRFCDDWC